MTHNGEVTRRGFLGAMGAGAVILGAAGMLPTSLAGAATLPKRGGSLRVGLSGGASSDSLNPLIPLLMTDDARVFNLTDPLCVYGRTGAVQNILAEEITPNADATVWTIRLRSGVTFHNGKDLTSQDVIYSLQQIVNKKAPGDLAPLLARVNIAGLKAIDKLTVQVPCLQPISTLHEFLAGWFCPIIPVGFDVRHPVGTGPFKFKSFKPGVESVFTRNESYWQKGLPYVDTLIISDYPSETSQINALASNQVDVISSLSIPGMKQVKANGGKVLISKSSATTLMYMRGDKPPFNDVNVTQAMRLLVDRPQMLEVVYGGYGTIGNDIYSYADPAYDHSIPQRVQDIAQAKYLLKKAGHENLIVTLVTAPISSGATSLATVFQQQASLAGVKVNLNLTTPGVEFGPDYAQFPFAQDYLIYQSYMTQVAFTNLPKSPFPETHFVDPAYDALFNQALNTVDQAKRYEIEHEMQKIDWERGTSIIANMYPQIDAHSPQVHGLETNVSGWPLNTFDFKSMWLS
jgi:peptide/nickel transport system substrate-binding protein